MSKDTQIAEEEQAHPCRLYIVSPPQFELDDFEKQLAAAFKGGDIGAFQLRMKEATDGQIMEAAKRLMPIVKEYEAAFILNDRPDLAFELGADGVHIGQDDVSFAEAREALGPDGVIGISCHASTHLAMEAGEIGADYVAFGAFYPTQSKPQEKIAKWGTPGPDILEWWATYTVVPCVAIGGVTPQNCGPLVDAGADFIAAISSVWDDKKGPKAAVKAFNQAIAKALHAKKLREGKDAA